jgi:hypothetical protein
MTGYPIDKRAQPSRSTRAYGALQRTKDVRPAFRSATALRPFVPAGAYFLFLPADTRSEAPDGAQKSCSKSMTFSLQRIAGGGRRGDKARGGQTISKG